jgi:pathogenesis-related protein 1
MPISGPWAHAPVAARREISGIVRRMRWTAALLGSVLAFSSCGGGAITAPPDGGAGGGTGGGSASGGGGGSGGGTGTGGGSATGGGSGTGGSGGTGGGSATGGGSGTGGGSATGGGAGGGSGAGGGTANELVAAHNAVRSAAMPVPSPVLMPMAWSPLVATVAQNWANNCNYMHNMNRGSLGENIFAASGGSWTPTAVVNSWASEKSDYTYSTNSCASGKMCGHYTQIVWRTSLGLGCGMKVCTTGSPFGSGTWVFWVCDYSPPGNYVGTKPY